MKLIEATSLSQQGGACPRGFLNGSTLLRIKSGPINVGWVGGQEVREHLHLLGEQYTAAQESRGVHEI